MFGFDENQLSGISFFELVHWEDRDVVVKRCQQGLKGEDVPGVFSFRMLNRFKEEMWVEMNAVPIQWEGRPAVLNFVRDVTEKRRLEAHFHRSQRMASIGTLARGIAHEFNNLLMAVQANASLIGYGKGPDDPDYDKLSHIETSVRKGADLVRQLLTFAREEKHRPEPTDINKLMERTEGLFARTKKEIRLHTAYQDDLPMVEVDPVQMEQVLMSLCINAWQAMPGGGEIFIETGVTYLGSDFVRPHGLESGKYVRIAVRDSGVGMDANTREQIFDPFFTTREAEQGLGLNLAAAYGIVRNHGGIMDVITESGKGSTFSIYLPVPKERAMGGKVEAHGQDTRL